MGRCVAVVGVVCALWIGSSGGALPAQGLEQLKTQARALMKAGRYAEAIGVYEQAVPLAEKTYGQSHYSTIVVVNELASACDANSEYRRAAPLYERCITALEAQRGPNDPELGTALNNLGVVYHTLGEYSRAEELLLRGLAISRRTNGASSPLNASKLNNLASLYKDLGDYPRAEPLYVEAVKMYEASNSDRLPLGLANLAGLYREMGQYDRAQPLYERSLKLREAKLGPSHPDVGTSLHGLGLLHRSKGELPQAEAYLQRALRIREAALGAQHASVGSTMNALASTYEAQGKLAEAEPLYRGALANREARLGPDNLDVVSTINNLAGLTARQGDLAEAERLYIDAIARGERAGGDAGFLSLVIGNLASLQASREMWSEAAASYDKTRRLVRSYVRRTLPRLTEREQLAFLRARDSRGFRAALSFGLLRRDDPAVAALSAEWLINGKGVTHEAMSRIATSAATDDPWVSLTSVRRALPDDAVLIEIMNLPVRDFTVLSTENRWGPQRYFVWIIPPEGRGDVSILDLGSADEIDGLVSAARSALTESARLVRTEGEPDAEEAALAALRPLSEQALQPLLKHVGDARRLILSPDASLWLVPWAALPLADGEYAVEKYELSHVVCGRDLTLPVAADASGPAVIFADPDYDLIPAQARAVLQALLRGVLPRVLQYAPSIKLPAAARLAGTAAEAAAVAPRIAAGTGQDPVLHLQAQAHELIVKIVQQPQMLVISTHGFFLEQQAAAGDDQTTTAITRPHTPDGKPLENPLLRCGLLLAGCNQGVPGEDGVLTGLEIVGMNLRGTRLVVLSACETGLGRIQNGEGVAGLRQAFQLAGARSVVASLWPVEDQSTARLMSAFFDHVAPDQSIAASLRDAQLEIIAARRERNGGAHPFFWSAFTVTDSGLPPRPSP